MREGLSECQGDVCLPSVQSQIPKSEGEGEKQGQRLGETELETVRQTDEEGECDRAYDL